MFDRYLDVDTQAVYKCILSLPVFQDELIEHTQQQWRAAWFFSPWSWSVLHILPAIGLQAQLFLIYLATLFVTWSKAGHVLANSGQTWMGQKSNIMRP